MPFLQTLRSAPPLTLVAFAMLGLPLNAAILYSTSFENPPFTTGVLAGQDGWGVFGPGISTVENTFAKTGSQAVFVDGGTASQSGPFRANTSAGPFVEVSADIALFSSTTQTQWQFAATGPGLSQFLGGINILPNNNIQEISGAFPIIGVFPKAGAFNGSAFHNLDFLFNIPAQTYNIKLDGVTLASGIAFCGTNSGCSGAVVPNYGDVIFDSFGTGNDSGYLDNLQVSQASNVPEPSSLFLFFLGLGGIASLIRRKSQAG